MTLHPRDDPDRYPFVVTVTSAFKGLQPLGFGAEDGRVICSAPEWWTGNGTSMQEEAIGLAYTNAVRLARKQRGE